MEKVYALVLAAGNGRRMGGEIAKQYRMLLGKPVICHTLAAFEESVVDEVILVVSAGMEVYAREEIVEKYRFCKVKGIVVGGRERCDSVYAGMCHIRTGCSGQTVPQDGVTVLVHDGARPLVTPELIKRVVETAKKEPCVVPAVPVKDTIKRGRDGFAQETLDRSALYAVQTPQAFQFFVLWEAFGKYNQKSGEATKQIPCITDDAMLVECMLGKKAALVEGDYCNIKLTTPEDMLVARAFLMRGEEHG